MLFAFWLSLLIAGQAAQRISLSPSLRAAYSVNNFSLANAGIVLLWHSIALSWWIARSDVDWPLLAAGLCFYLVGWWLATWAMRSNPHCSPVIKCPPERITTGAYAWFRHPMYAGCSLQGCAAVLVLNNALGLLPLAAYVGIVIGRARIENKLLRGL